MANVGQKLLFCGGRKIGQGFQLYFAIETGGTFSYAINEGSLMRSRAETARLAAEWMEDAMMVREEIFRSCCRNFIRF